MNHLDQLEHQSIFIMREAYANFDDLAMLWSVGKDSTVLLWLAKKAFFGHVPFPIIHIDTSFKIPQMIEFRNNIAREWGLNLIYGINQKAIDEKQTFPDNTISRTECCKLLKADALDITLKGIGKTYKLNLDSGHFEQNLDKVKYNGLILGIRSDEEGSRSKERYFSPRGNQNNWEIEKQPPEIWNQYKTEFAPGTHVRIHPLLDWTELNIWEYIKRENLKLVDLYYDKGEGKRYRSLGCYPCTKPIDSHAKNVDEIIAELKEGKLKNIAERSGRAQDQEGSGAGLENLRKDGYM